MIYSTPQSYLPNWPLLSARLRPNNLLLSNYDPAIKPTFVCVLLTLCVCSLLFVNVQELVTQCLSASFTSHSTITNSYSLLPFHQLFPIKHFYHHINQYHPSAASLNLSFFPHPITFLILTKAWLSIGNHSPLFLLPEAHLHQPWLVGIAVIFLFNLMHSHFTV